MPLKRKASSQATNRPSKRTKRPNAKDKQNEDFKTPSNFLDLPAELRNNIYEYDIHNTKTTLPRKARGRLVSDSPSTRVSRQIREEFQGILYAAAPTIQAKVTDLNFGHMIRFFNTVSDHDLSSLPKILDRSVPVLDIQLHFTDSCSANPEGLLRWLLRSEKPSKRGTKVDTSYSSHQRFDYLTTLSEEYAVILRVQKQMRKKISKVDDGRLKVEMTKLLREITRILVIR